MATFSRLIVIGAVLALVACGVGPKGSIGFSLPDGDVAKGEEHYIEFRCNACHGSDKVPQMETDGEPVISVRLGGQTTRIKSYGELVTSIINPSHRIARRYSKDMKDESGQSKMIIYNDVMTVTQLIDLVAFVQSSYTLLPYRQSHYPVYWIPEPERQN